MLSQANAQITNILSFVEGIYESEIGLSFQIVQQIARSDANTDPYTSTAPSTRLQQFRDHWNTNFPNSGANARSLAHLFTGVDLDGSTPSESHRLALPAESRISLMGFHSSSHSGSSSITAQTVVLTAHEIGHNFSASHTNQPTSDVPADIERPCEETIMEASVGDRFRLLSVFTFANRRTC